MEAGHTDLPLTYRTLMQTNKKVNTVKINATTEVYYYNPNDEIVKNLQRYPQAQVVSLPEVSVQLHFDGIPLYKSSSATLWPLLCSFSNMIPRVIFPLNLALCETKPQDVNYLSATVNDLNNVIDSGVIVHGINIPVEITMIVADAPARSMARATKGHTGYYGCGRCKERGAWVENRLVYLNTDNLVERTDAEFRNRTDEEHHLPERTAGVSPFLPLPIDMVTSFPLDYMHCCCLGVYHAYCNF